MAAALWLFVPGPGARLDRYPASIRLCDREGAPLRVVLGEQALRCDPIDVSATGDWAVAALIAAEDKRFRQHAGIDPIAVGRAMAQNLASGRVVSGASTLSTQVIRLAIPRPRTVATKIRETIGALKMERRLSKDDILTQYLNRAPFGGNLVGIQAASRRYFGKNAADLSLGEAALLVGLPQSPSRFRPDRHLPRALARRRFVLARMEALGFIDRRQKEAAERQRIEVGVRADPFAAPHFCDLVWKRCADLPPGITDLRTSLDARLQSAAQDELRRRAAAGREQGVYGGAVVVIEVASGAVRALVGSPDFADAEHAGQMNGAMGLRSPGSALKPFVYALAFDRGLCVPATVVADTPLYFRDYEPRNFDLDFNGPVTVREALVQSLNIPAVAMVRQVGLDAFVESLRRLGLRSIDKPASHYGLAIALGGVEVRLLDLANAYACLARLGLYRPYGLLECGPAGADARAAVPMTDRGRQLFSEEAAYLVADVLGGDERAWAATGHAADVRLPRVAWKTGTSAGGRDAWAVGYNPEYVVGVWIGNPDGTPGRGLQGVTAAAPIMLDLFRRIYPSGDAPWFVRPERVRSRTVCAGSGSPPNPHCERCVEDLYIRGRSDPAPCCVHGRRAAATPVRIVRPQAGSAYRLQADLPASTQVLELRALAGESGPLYWFVDDVFIGSVAAGESRFWPLARGRHVMVCADASGRADRVAVEVE